MADDGDDQVHVVFPLLYHLLELQIPKDIAFILRHATCVISIDHKEESGDIEFSIDVASVIL